MQAFRTDFAVGDGDEEDRLFFDVGVEKSGRSRHKLEHQLRRRKLMLGIGISVGVVGLITLVVGLAWALGHKNFGYDCPDSFKRSDADLIFFVVSLTEGTPGESWEQSLPLSCLLGQRESPVTLTRHANRADAHNSSMLMTIACIL